MQADWARRDIFRFEAVPGWFGIGWKALEYLSTLDFVRSKIPDMALHLTPGDVACLAGIIWLAWLVFRGSDPPLARARLLSAEYRELARRWPDSEAVKNPAAFFWRPSTGAVTIDADKQAVMDWTRRVSEFLNSRRELEKISFRKVLDERRATQSALAVLAYLAEVEDAFLPKLQGRTVGVKHSWR